MPDGEGQYLAFADAAWARLRSSDRGRLRAAEGPDDMWDVGDVILVKAVEKDGAFDHWSYRQIPAIQGGFMAMDTQTGRVLAMQGGFSYQSSVFNRATQALRQPGSSFKPFVYAAALDSGYSPSTIVLDAPIEVATGAGIWKPENAGNTYYGPTPMRTGIEQSRNLMTVRIAQDVGMDTVAKYGERFGIYDKMPHLLSYSLGAGETTLYRMVTAYAELANGGLKVEPTLVDRVQDRYGKTIYRHDQRACEGCAADDIASATQPLVHSNAERVMDAITAYQVTSMLQGAVARGTSASLGRPARPQPRRQDRHHQRGQGRLVHRLLARASSPAATWATTPRGPLGESAFGGTLCAPIFVDFIKKAMEGQGPVTFPVPPGGHFIKIDRHTGQRLSDVAERRQRAGGVHPRRPGAHGRRLRQHGRRRLEDGRRRAALRERAQLAGHRAGDGPRQVQGAAGEPDPRHALERRALLSPPAPAHARVLRALFLAAGLLFTAIGLVGVVLPVLPTTPFLILAAACFARSSVRLERWLLDHPRLGPPLRAWRERGAIPPRAKAMAAAGSARGFVAFRLASRPRPARHRRRRAPHARRPRLRPHPPLLTLPSPWPKYAFRPRPTRHGREGERPSAGRAGAFAPPEAGALPRPGFTPSGRGARTRPPPRERPDARRDRTPHRRDREVARAAAPAGGLGDGGAPARGAQRHVRGPGPLERPRPRPEADARPPDAGGRARRR